VISYNSRYQDSALATVTAPDGSQRVVIVPSPQLDYTFTFTEYQVIGSDRPDLLAWRFYSDATQWWQIADGNPEITDWTNVPSGTLIRIPAV
jgi:phage tail protein X